MRALMRQSKREQPPGRSSAAVWFTEGSGFDGICALAVFAFGGNNGQAHFLPDGPGKEPAHRMRLPAAGFLQFLTRRAARPLQQVQDLRRFAAVAGAGGFLRAFGRSFGRGSLLARLPLPRPDGRDTCASAGLFRGFRLLDGGLAGCVFSFLNRCGHVFVLFGGDYRGHDMDHSGAWRKQVDCSNRTRGDGLAMAIWPPETCQMSSGVLR
jgi:hypothetical protein